jgi:hypothetical protein
MFAMIALGLSEIAVLAILGLGLAAVVFFVVRGQKSAD